MIPLDAQQQRLLERLRKAGDQPVAFGELHAGGIDFQAAVVPELELNGYVIERVYDHGRLVGVRLAARRAAPATPMANRRAPGDHGKWPMLRVSCVRSRMRARRSAYEAAK